jgi:hypothetical protein
MYYVIFEQYAEYNQFSGSWDLQLESYELAWQAVERVAKLNASKSGDYREVKLLEDFYK